MLRGYLEDMAMDLAEEFGLLEEISEIIEKLENEISISGGSLVNLKLFKSYRTVKWM